MLHILKYFSVKLGSEVLIVSLPPTDTQTSFEIRLIVNDTKFEIQYVRSNEYLVELRAKVSDIFRA